LQAFDAFIKALPKTLSAGDKNGPIAANFTSHKFDSDEGPYYSFDKAWNRTFQVLDTQPTTPASPSKSFFMEAIRMYPCLDGNALAWWKKHANEFPVLSRIARDILAIPGVSISVERLFSSSNHTLSDTRSSMTAESASKTGVVKKWLKKGLGEGIDFLDGFQVKITD